MYPSTTCPRAVGIFWPVGFAGAWWHVLGARFVDRVGKGLRTAPRDALIAESTSPEQRGRAFGLHRAMDTAVAIINASAAKIDGVKISLLDKDREIAMRRRLDKNVKMYTGDDFNYAELMAGDAQGHSHGLLGIFDPIAPVAAVALGELAAGNVARFRELLDPTVALSREIFRAPTRHYKAGVVFLAWLNGHQRHFSMAAGLQSARGAVHYARVFELADQCGVLADPDLACRRMQAFLSVNAGIDS